MTETAIGDKSYATASVEAVAAIYGVFFNQLVEVHHLTRDEALSLTQVYLAGMTASTGAAINTERQQEG